MIKRIAMHRLEIVAFGTGFSLMAFELAAARILAPAIGSSMYVWTSVIGVIIASLSLGFYIGGHAADRRGRASDISLLLLAATTAIATTLICYSDLLPWVAETFTDGRAQGVVAALALFAPASFLIGVTSPYLAKLNVRSLQSTGRSIASLDACNALGGIVGTFVTGFFLFSFVGSRETIIFVALLLLAMSWLTAVHARTTTRLVVTGLLLLLLIVPSAYATATQRIDTASAHYEVLPLQAQDGEVVGLMTGPHGVQSAVYEDGRDNLVFWYTQQMTKLTIDRKPASVLILGGGAFTMPQYLAEKLPNAHIDVVEIDPHLKEISEKYFNYTNPKNVRLFFEDARTFVNREGSTYDVILVDVYGDTMIPFALMTKEYGQAISRHLNPKGTVIVNLVAGPTGACADIFTAINAVYGSELTFAQYRTQSEDTVRANYVVAYSRIAQLDLGYTPVQMNPLNAYDDNFTPSERLYFDCLQQTE